MPQPDDPTLAEAARHVLGLASLPVLGTRRVLHTTLGRAVERVEIDGRSVAVKWRDDRPKDREALLYRNLTTPALGALHAPEPLGSITLADNTHVLFLAWVDGRSPDWASAEDVRLAFSHLGRVHAATSRLLEVSPEALAAAEAWPELMPRDSVMVAEPLVLDPGDLHAGNFLICPDGTVCVLDFENMAVRPRDAALRPLWEDGSLPQGVLAQRALSAYWTGAEWADDLAAFQRRVEAHLP